MVSAEEFVRIWQQSSSSREVAEKTGLSSGAVQGRAYLYRRRGIRLKVMANIRNPRLGVDDLNALIDSLGNGEAPAGSDENVPTAPKKVRTRKKS